MRGVFHRGGTADFVHRGLAGDSQRIPIIVRILGSLLAPVSICALSGAAVFAQATGQIGGRVTDPTSAVLPGVEVTVTQTETGLGRTAVTNEAGAYTFPNLAVGPYRLEATLPGFRAFVQTGIMLQVGARLTIDAALEVGEVAQRIEVQAHSLVQVETRSMSIGEVVEDQRILELPLAARDTNSLIMLSGAGAVDQGFGPVGTMVTGTRISVAGNQIFGVQHLLDGAMHNNRFNESNMPAPFPDALGEFRVNTSAQEASTGRASGASVNSVTKSGTNAFHGNLFWFVRNAVFNAKKADATSKDQLKRNQPGVAIGGPIVRNKLFFFTGYQSTIERASPSDLFSIVPTTALLNGDWSTFNQCYGPDWRDADFADGVVNPARYSAAARLLAARLPQTSDPCGGIRTGSRSQRHDKQTVSRIDYQQTPNHSIFGRYMGTFQDAPVSFDPQNLLTVTGNSNSLDNTAHSAIVGNTWVISPNTISSSRFAYNRIATRLQGPEFFDPIDVGINQWTSVPKIFNFTLTGFFSFGLPTTARRAVFQNQYQIGNDTTLSRGTHQIAFGATWSRDDIDSVAHTRGVGLITTDSTVTGNAMGDFLLGRVNNIRQSMPSILSPYQHYVGLYVQDTWRAAPRLTVNAGLRWEPFFPMIWAENELGGIRVYRFSPEGFKGGQKSVVFPSAPAGFAYPSQAADGSGPADFEGAAPTEKKWNQFGPRVGLAWDPSRTSVRAGYGIAYDLSPLSALINSNNVSPWALDVIHRNGTLDNPWQGFSGGNPFPFDWRTNPKFSDGSVFLAFSPDGKIDTTYTQSWNLAIQQELAGAWRLSASYLGNHGVKLWLTEATNPALVLSQESNPGLFTGPDTCVLEGQSYTPCNQTGNINQRRELRLWAAANDPALLADARLFSTIDTYRSASTSTYHALLTTVRGTVGGVTLDANYTWAHCISDRVNVAISNPNQSPHRGRDRANCASDRRQIFNLTAVASTPQFVRPGLRAVASGWRFSVISRISSGSYLNITTSDRALTGLADQLVNQVLEDVYQDRSGKLNSQYLNRAAFAQPALGTYGNLGYFSVLGPGTWSLDTAVSRTFQVQENQRFEVRAEAFNATNSVRPNNPNTGFNSGTFGRITSVQDPRIMQFALKYVF